MRSVLWICYFISSLALSALAAISPLSIKGTKFFDANGNQIFFKGMAYQRAPFDPFLNGTQCQLDAQLMQYLGVNVIRTYHVDPTGNHDECMQAFATAGIYLFLDLDTFNTQIEQSNPMWNASMYAAFTKVIDAFDQYENLAGFFIANEAVTTSDGTAAAPYVKAAVRDTKAYMKKKGGRYIPIGYSAADIASIRPMFQNYLACGDPSIAIDFFAVNIYEWCGNVDYTTSGYSQRIAELQGYPIPAFFSETGCNVVRPRTFTDMTAIFGPNMTPVLSGAIVYEWTQEANNYGIITYPDSTLQSNVAVPIGSPIPMQPEFDTLKSVWAACSPSSIALSAYTPSITTIACPATTVGWPVDPSAPLPPSPTTDIVPGSRTTYVFTTGPSVMASAPSGVSIVVGAATTETLGDVVGPTGGASAKGSDVAASSAAASSTVAAHGSGANRVSETRFELLAFVLACIVLGCIV